MAIYSGEAKLRKVRGPLFERAYRPLEPVDMAGVFVCHCGLEDVGREMAPPVHAHAEALKPVLWTLTVGAEREQRVRSFADARARRDFAGGEPAGPSLGRATQVRR